MRGNYFDGIDTTDEQVRECLNSRYPRNEDGNKWTTPFGISFATPEYQCKYQMDWQYIYDKEGTALAPDGREFGEFSGGWLEKREVMRLVKRFDQEEEDEGFSVYKKPKAVEILENIFHVEARLHYLHCLIWHIKVNGVSCNCNPFDLCHTYASGDWDFEALFKGDDDTTDYIDVYSLLNKMKTKGLIPPSKLCAACGEISFSKEKKCLPNCGRCKDTYYCDKKCQKQDWLENDHASKCVKK